jgi:NADPH2:quinone reductase
VRSGRLQVRIGETWPLGEAAHAHERLQGRRTAGKVLLKP